tara:strand:- start:1187 stop:1552 length:366 start_codon:yes stop_codon:yes gene_type:complete
MAHQSVYSFHGGGPKLLGSLKSVVHSGSVAAAGWSFVVRAEGFEPPRLSALDPKSSVSTNFTTPANYAEASRRFERCDTLRNSSLLSINPWCEMRTLNKGVLGLPGARTPCSCPFDLNDLK